MVKKRGTRKTKKVDAVNNIPCILEPELTGMALRKTTNSLEILRLTPQPPLIIYDFQIFFFIFMGNGTRKTQYAVYSFIALYNLNCVDLSAPDKRLLIN